MDYETYKCEPAAVCSDIFDCIVQSWWLGQPVCSLPSVVCRNITFYFGDWAGCSWASDNCVFSHIFIKSGEHTVHTNRQQRSLICLQECSEYFTWKFWFVLWHKTRQSLTMRRHIVTTVITNFLQPAFKSALSEKLIVTPFWCVLPPKRSQTYSRCARHKKKKNWIIQLIVSDAFICRFIPCRFAKE